MSYIAGIDIGNSTTEVCVGEVGAAGTVHFLTSASCPTTGTKGTPANVHGIKAALKQAMAQIGQEIDALSCIRLNEAAPVIGDTAMETLTETIITDSSMLYSLQIFWCNHLIRRSKRCYFSFFHHKHFASDRCRIFRTVR